MEAIIDNKQRRIIIIGHDVSSALSGYFQALAESLELPVVTVHTETKEQAEEYKGLIRSLYLMDSQAQVVAEDFRDLTKLASPIGYNRPDRRAVESSYFVEKRSSSRKAYKIKPTTFGKAAYTEKRK